MTLNKSKLLILLLTASLPAAGSEPGAYAKPRSHLGNPIAPYTPRTVPEPVFSNTPRIDQMLRDGKLMLSLNDAIALALENNLDLAISRYNLAIADTDVLRASAGAPVRGVATGLVQGTPGGGIGGFGGGAPGAGAGGTTGGAGGAGTGASGLVQSTLGAGAPISSYDPTLTASFNLNQASFPLSNTVVSGVPSLRQNTGIANFSYFQAFGTGTSISIDFDNSRATNNSRFSILVPELRSNFRVFVRQRLLAGFGLNANQRFIRIAKNNREISDVAFRNQVIATVSQIQNIYWDLVNAYEDLKVRERSVALAQKALHDSREQVRIGAMAPMEAVVAETEVAQRSQDFLQAQVQLQLQQLLVKNAISRTLKDPVLAAAEVVPTDTVALSPEEPVVPTQDLIREALASRAELVQARIDLTNRNISRRAATNAMRPTLDLVAWYGGSGLAGLQNAANTGLAPGSVPPTGFADAVGNLFGNDFPDYAVGLNLNVPIRNRAAQADQVRSELEYRQAQMRIQQIENQIGIEVRNAQFAVHQYRSRVEAARKARDMAQHTLGIEQKRLALGASTSNAVLQVQRDVAQAESALVSAMSAYAKARVELDRATGNTLTRNRIELPAAERGRVEKMPDVPGLAPRSDLNNTTTEKR